MDDSELGAMFGAALMLEGMKRISVDWWGGDEHFPYDAFYTANLTHIRLSLPSTTSSPSFAMTHLQEVEVNFSDGIQFTSFASSAPHLLSLTIYANVPSPVGLTSLTSLTSLTFNCPAISTTAYLDNFAIPPSLLHLSINSWPSANLSIGDSSSRLESLSLTGSNFLTTITRLPSSLRGISFRGLPNLSAWHPIQSPCLLERFSLIGIPQVPLPTGLNDCANMQVIHLSSLNNDAYDSALSLLGDFPLLNSLTLADTATWPPTAGMMAAQISLCSLPPSSGTRSLSLANTQYTSLIDCSWFAQLLHLDLIGVPFFPIAYSLGGVSTGLQTLKVSTMAVGGSAETRIEWGTLAAQFRQLRELSIVGPHLECPFPDLELRQLTQLEVLSLPNLLLNGSIPESFLESLPNLSILNLANNKLDGTIPSRGWSNLTSVKLGDNLFEAWPSVEAPGAPKLETLEISVCIMLTSLPSDSDFMMMTKLRYLEIAHSLVLNVPAPAFWMQGQHKLISLLAGSSSFQGPLSSSLQSPYIRNVDLSNNQLCGPLPEITAPVTMEMFNFRNNHFSGSIPYSWGSSLSIKGFLFISENLLMGTLPERVIKPDSVAESIDFSGNFFSGPFPNVSVSYLMNFLGVGVNMTWDACARDPSFPASVLECLVPFHPSFCSCLSYFTDCFGSLNSYCTGVPMELVPDGGVMNIEPPIPIEPPHFQCFFANPQPQPNTCPGNAPGASFQCIDGTWKSLGSVTQPSLTIPGTTIPGTTVTIIIDGNLTITDGGITFNGFQSQVIVNGCIFLGENMVTIELTKEEIEQLEKEGKLSKTLLTSLNENKCLGSSDLSTTTLTVHKDPGSKGCRKVNAKHNGSTKSSLNVVFHIDNSTCNMIIIIPTVLGAVLIITAIALGIGLYLRKLKFAPK